MDLRPLALALALIAPAANACDYTRSAEGPCGWVEYPSVPDYGTRTDIYLDEHGRVEAIYKHQATGEGDNLRIYNDSMMQIDGDLDGIDDFEGDFDE